MRLAALILAALVAPAAAHAGFQPGSPPQLCAGDAFTDQVGTPGNDELSSPGPAQRIYGLAGSDRLTGSRTRATCLFGGANDDVLNLAAGGGIAFGEEGRDLVFGSDVGDIVFGGPGIDGLAAGGGRDQVNSRDGRPEVVGCGAGEDRLVADRVDVRFGCETVSVAGPEGPRLDPTPDRTWYGGTVTVTARAPRGAKAGAYRFIYVSDRTDGSCGDGDGVLARLGRVARGQRVKVRIEPPDLGWCHGRAQVALLRDLGYGRPAVPIARFSFSVR